MADIAIHPKSIAMEIEAALDRILARDPPQIGMLDIVSETLGAQPEWESRRDQLSRMAGDALRCRFDFGILREEAAALKARDPATLTCEEREAVAARLCEIGAAFKAAAAALESES